MEPPNHFSAGPGGPCGQGSSTPRRLLPWLLLLLIAPFGLTAMGASSPTISFGAAPSEIGDASTSQPFTNVSIADADGDNVTVTISFPAERGTFPTHTLTVDSSGVYTLSGRSAANAVSFLANVTFTPGLP